MAKRAIKIKPVSHAQRASMLNNNCLRTFAAMERALELAGHTAMATRIKQMETLFRNELNKGE